MYTQPTQIVQNLQWNTGQRDLDRYTNCLDGHPSFTAHIAVSSGMHAVFLMCFSMAWS